MIKRAWGTCAGYHNKIQEFKLHAFEQRNIDMARKLTKCDRNGKPYVRPGKVEAEIDAVSKLSAEVLQERLNLTKPGKSGYISSECLVYLVREALRSKNDDWLHAPLHALLARCRAILMTRISDKMIPDAEGVREEILGRFGEMLAEDKSGGNPRRLDFYEVRFNAAFHCFYLDVIRKEQKHSRNAVPLPEAVAESDAEGHEEAMAWIPEVLQSRETPEDVAFRDELFRAIESLPLDEQKVVGLCYLGYKAESRDPAEETIATLCNCSGRTVRNRLAKVAGKLQKFKESIS